MQFQNQVAIITGAASGIGLLAAQNFAKQGAQVVLTDVNATAVQTEAKKICNHGGNAIGMEVDVRKYDQVRAAVQQTLEKYSRIDIMLNSAGGSSTRIFNRNEPFHELPIEVIDWGLDVNLKGAVYFCHAVLGMMLKQKNGVIINMGSVTGVEGSAGAVDYSAAKSGIIGLTKSLALCGASHGVRACCVSPGPVLTRPEMENMKTRLGRAAQPQEIVDLILYLCSDKANFITGTNYLIDGGRTLGGMN